MVAGQGRGGMVAAGSVVLDPCAGLPVETTWAGELITEMGEGMGAATFEVRTGSHCARCPARRSCPMHERGRQVTG